MTSPISILWTLCTLMLFQAPQVQNASPASFVGTWVGHQTRAIANPSPSAKEEQAVTLTIQLVDGKLTGFMDPFFGGADGASFVDVQIVGEQLQASAVVGKPRPATAAGAAARRDWKSNTKIVFNFKTEPDFKLVGTADVTLSEVKWLKFNYDLSKKRSRY